MFQFFLRAIFPRDQVYFPQEGWLLKQRVEQFGQLGLATIGCKSEGS